MPYSSRLQRAFLLSPPPQRQAAAPVLRGGLFIKPKGSKQKPPHSRAVAFIWKILPVFPGGPSRLLAFGKGGGPGKAFGADVRQRPAQARPSAAAPRRELTAEALRRCVAARAKPPSRLRQGRGGCTPGMPASCVPQGRKGPSKTSGVDALFPLNQARRKPPLRGANRPVRARTATCSREHPPRGFRPYS